MSREIITFGCRLNAYESEVIKNNLEQASIDNVAVFNTCAVTKEAERQAKQAIRRYRRENPSHKIIVTGCAAQINPQKYADMPEVDKVLGNEEKMKKESFMDSGYEDRTPKSVLSRRDMLEHMRNINPHRKGRNPSGGLTQEGEQEASRAISPRSGALSENLGNRNNNYEDRIMSESTSKLAASLGKRASPELRSIAKLGNFAGNNVNTKILVNDIMSVKETASHLVAGLEGKSRAFVQVQNGCNHRCTFCIIPYGRGNSRSVPIGEIVTQVQKLVNSGYKEIVLTGVDISDYGLDLPGSPRLGQMIRRLLSLVPTLPRIRLSSIDVAEIDDELLKLIANEHRLMPHLHLSLQSGDDMILKRMKRRHLRQDIIDFCKKARLLRPDIVFGADIIAGFPTETEEMFQNTLNIIEEAGLTYLHVFPYSEREGTPAAKMPQVAKKTRKERAEILRKAGEQAVAKFLKTRIGKEESVIVENENIGRTEHFALVQLTVKNTAGSLIKAEIKGADSTQLLAA